MTCSSTLPFVEETATEIQSVKRAVSMKFDGNAEIMNSYERPPKSPVLKVTRYDRVSSFLMAIAISLVIALVWLSVVWVMSRMADSTFSAPLVRN